MRMNIRDAVVIMRVETVTLWDLREGVAVR